MVELPAASMWFPRNTDPLDPRHELQVTLPTGWPDRPACPRRSLTPAWPKPVHFKSAQDILAPTLVAGRYQVQDYTSTA